MPTTSQKQLLYHPPQLRENFMINIKILNFNLNVDSKNMYACTRLIHVINITSRITSIWTWAVRIKTTALLRVIEKNYYCAQIIHCKSSFTPLFSFSLHVSGLCYLQRHPKQSVGIWTEQLFIQMISTKFVRSQVQFLLMPLSNKKQVGSSWIIEVFENNENRWYY